MTLPRYVQAYQTADNTTLYRFNPPQNLILAGVVGRVSLGSVQPDAYAKAHELNAKIDAWRLAMDTTISRRSKLSELADDYFESSNFKLLRAGTQRDYRYFIGVAVATLNDPKFHTVTSRQAKAAYEEWVEQGISFANHVCATVNMLYNYAKDREYCITNPFVKVKRKQAMQRKIVWQHEHVMQFLDTAYSEWRWRNIGLIVQMGYEWVQRIGDMRNLTWDSLDMDNKILNLEQSKRRAEVRLPISEGLHSMLAAQQDDFGFQQYVAPMLQPRAGKYLPYTKTNISKLGRKVMSAAKLPKELWLMDLRRTGTTQMNDAGVPMGQIMSVTGHANPQSVKPYINHTYTSANSALTTREEKRHV